MWYLSFFFVYLQRFLSVCHADRGNRTYIEKRRTMTSCRDFDKTANSYLTTPSTGKLLFVPKGTDFLLHCWVGRCLAVPFKITVARGFVPLFYHQQASTL